VWGCACLASLWRPWSARPSPCWKEALIWGLPTVGVRIAGLLGVGPQAAPDGKIQGRMPLMQCAIGANKWMGQMSSQTFPDIGGSKNTYCLLRASPTGNNGVLIYSVLDPTLTHHTISMLQKCDRPITSFPMKSV
jgi:hypothetical protein